MRNEAILIVPKNVIGGSSDPPHPGRSEDLPGTGLIKIRKIGKETIRFRHFKILIDNMIKYCIICQNAVIY